MPNECFLIRSGRALLQINRGRGAERQLSPRPRDQRLPLGGIVGIQSFRSHVLRLPLAKERRNFTIIDISSHPFLRESL